MILIPTENLTVSLRKGANCKETQPADAPQPSPASQTHNCIRQSRLMLMRPGWKWQDIEEGWSLNEPLRDQSWLLTISLQFIRQGNRSLSVSLRHSPHCPLPPALHKQTNYSNRYKLDPFPENAPSTFFRSFLTQLQSACPPDGLYTHTDVHAHTCTHTHKHTCACICRLGCTFCFLFFCPAWL